MNNEMELMAPLPTEEDVLINWWLQSGVVKRALGLTVRIPPMSDFFVLKEFSWGVLAYDYEEGLKLKTTFAQLPEAVKWLREFHRQQHIGFIRDDARAVINAHSMVSSRELSSVNKPKFEAAGFIADQYDTWSLV